MVDLMLELYNLELPGYPCVFPSWDNTARRGQAGKIFVNSEPAKYERWLRAAIRKTQGHFPPEQAFIFINTWNEWDEGAYLEPDEDYGYAYLNATGRAMYSSE